MTQSMTAFGRASLDGKSGRYTCEIRTVNHRYLEINIRLPEELRQFESDFRQLFSKRLSRGRLDCFIKKSEAEGALDGAKLNENTINQLNELSKQVESELSNVQPLRMIDVLKWPNVLDTPEVPEEIVKQESLELIGETLDNVVAARSREGDKLNELLQTRLTEMSEIINSVDTLVPQINDVYRLKLTEKLEQVKSDLDETRVEQEMIIYLQKSDVAEEIDRLNLHIKEVTKTLNSKKPVGRRLDFLMQELNREANTLGSKSHNAELTQHAVDLKVLIEQMREQVQNIE